MPLSIPPFAIRVVISARGAWVASRYPPSTTFKYVFDALNHKKIRIYINLARNSRVQIRMQRTTLRFSPTVCNQAMHGLLHQLMFRCCLTCFGLEWLSGRGRRHVTLLQYAAYMLHIRAPSDLFFDALFWAKKLFHEFMCDLFASSEQHNLRWIKKQPSHHPSAFIPRNTCKIFLPHPSVT